MERESACVVVCEGHAGGDEGGDDGEQAELLRADAADPGQLGQRGRNVSVGQRQLISFARALVADPQILILDEATANIDSFTEQAIQKALKVLFAGRTCMVIAHRLSTIRDADTILVMENGAIVEQGNHLELLERDGAYARLYNSQFAGAAIEVEVWAMPAEPFGRFVAAVPPPLSVNTTIRWSAAIICTSTTPSRRRWSANRSTCRSPGGRPATTRAARTTSTARSTERSTTPSSTRS